MGTSSFHKHVLVALFASCALYPLVGVRLEDEEQDENNIAVEPDNVYESKGQSALDRTGVSTKQASTKVAPLCTDVPNWKDTEGRDCAEIVENKLCEDDDDHSVVDPQLACCGCGGGQAGSSATAEAVLGAAGSNTCPTGSVTISSAMECRAALHQLLIRYGIAGEETNADFPKGCYFCPAGTEGCGDGGVWFNRHGTGGASAKTIPICLKKTGHVSKGGMVFLGDSDIDYWVNSSARFPGSVNVGVGGATCKDAVALVDEVQESLEPSDVVLVCGENDMDGGGKSASQAFANFKLVMNKFHPWANPKGQRIVMFGTKPEPESKKVAGKFQDYDRKVRQYAIDKAAKNKGNPRFVFVDVHKSFLAMGNKRNLYADDGVHMSPKGYSYWEEWAAQVLADTTGCVVWENGKCVSVKPASA